VNAPHPRDRAVEALLRRQQQTEPVRTAACPDPEVLAAWAGNALDAVARENAEEHLAGCAHCQAVMAAIVQSEPVAATAPPWWSRLHLRWLVPLTAAAAATVLWVAVEPGVPDAMPPIAPESQAAQAERKDTGISEREAVRPAAPIGPVPESARSPAKQLSGQSSTGGAPAGNPAGNREGRAQPREESPPAEALADSQILAKEVAPEGVAASDEARRQGARAAEKGAQAPPPTPAVDAAAPPAPLQETVGAPSTRALGRAPGAGAFGAVAAGTIASGDSAVSWRFAGPGVVERTTDRGVTWQRVELGMAGVFTSGFAPSRTVCWLIGAGGLVAVTTDGQTWRQLPPPAGAAELTSVSAEDGRTATVRDAAGRAFRTTDGGATWSSVP